MRLIREHKEKHRKVYFCDDRYRKEWYSTTPDWIHEHVQLLNKVVPGYVLGFGPNWIEYKILSGIPASTFPHTPEFIDRIYKFCRNNIQETAPYVHGDWALSNIIIDNNNIQMCDWDNLGIYHPDDVLEKLHEDLNSAFGPSFQEYISSIR